MPMEAPGYPDLARAGLGVMGVEERKMSDFTDVFTASCSVIPAKDLTLGPSDPPALVFCADDKWVLKISAKGLESNPEVPADEGAKAILAALEPYLNSYISDAYERGFAKGVHTCRP